MSMFLTFLKLHFSGLKSIHFYPEYQKTIFSGLIFPKNTHEKIFLLWIKSIIYLGNFDFLDFSKTSLLMSKKHSYLSRISKNRLFLLNLPNKYLWENIRFFHKNHELTPLKNFDFLGFFKTLDFEIFPERLTHVFGLKMAIFASFSLGNIGHENVF